MAEIPFLHPALLGVGIAAGVIWSALAPQRLRSARWIATAAIGAAGLAGVLEWVPWAGHLQLSAYGICLLAAFALGWWIMLRRARTCGIDSDHVRAQLALAAIAGILGARVWYVIEYQHHDSYLSDPHLTFGQWLTRAADLDRGGAVWYGGLFLAMTAMVIHTRRAGVPLLPWADCVAPAVLAALAVGRLGCWFNGCCYGASCDLPWAVTRVVPSATPDAAVKLAHVHPTQIYEAIACTVLALVVARNSPGSGKASGWALVGYALWRAFNESMRGDYANKLGQGFSWSPLHLTSAQWTALPLFVLGVWLLLRRKATT